MFRHNSFVRSSFHGLRGREKTQGTLKVREGALRAGCSRRCSHHTVKADTDVLNATTRLADSTRFRAACGSSSGVVPQVVCASPRRRKPGSAKRELDVYACETTPPADSSRSTHPRRFGTRFSAARRLFSPPPRNRRTRGGRSFPPRPTSSRFPSFRLSREPGPTAC